MKTATLLLSCLLLTLNLQAQPGPYQDVYVNGKTLKQGHGPDCEARYEALKKVLDLYDRPIKILDIGAAEGYFSFRAAHEYGASAVMIGNPKHKNNILQKLCVANTQLDKIILLSKRISLDELEMLAEKEHFDVVLALNIIHHFKDWERAYETILKLGDQIIIETPPNGDAHACGLSRRAPINARIDREPHTLLGQFQRHTDPTQIDRLVWISMQPANSFIVEGIHWSTFQALNGTYPTGPKLKKAMGKILFK